MKKITINPVFRSLIPALAPEEFDQLEKNIIADGCRDPLVCWGGTLIDGHNRFEICTKRNIPFDVSEKTFKDQSEAEIWIIQNQFGRRNLAPFVRGELALKLEPLISARAKGNLSNKQPGKHGNSPLPISAKVNTRDEVASIAGMGHDTIAKVKFIKEHATPEAQSNLRKPDGPSINRVYKETKDAKQIEARKEKREKQASLVELASGVVVGDFQEHADKVADGSLSLIFTDPPYNRDAEKTFPGLADFAHRKLADGGSIIFYLGHLQLPAAFAAFDGKLRHWWTCACLHGGDKALMREYGIRVGWKPMLWFVKGTRDNKSNILFDVVTGAKEKAFHDWQQYEADATYYIENLCPKDGIVCDPFLGGGTTAAAAKALGRKWVGFEIDAETAKIASGRLQ